MERYEMYNTVIDSRGVLSRGAKWTFAVLWRYADKSGNCFPSMNTICESAGYSWRQARKHIRELEEAGFLNVIYRNNGRSNLYKLVVPDSEENEQSEVFEDSEENEQSEGNHEEDLNLLQGRGTTKCRANITNNNSFEQNTNTCVCEGDVMGELAQEVAAGINAANIKNKSKGRCKASSVLAKVYLEEIINIETVRGNSAEKAVENIKKAASELCQTDFKGDWLTFRQLWPKRY